jgi:hypothetical protein
MILGLNSISAVHSITVKMVAYVANNMWRMFDAFFLCPDAEHFTCIAHTRSVSNGVDPPELVVQNMAPNFPHRPESERTSNVVWLVRGGSCEVICLQALHNEAVPPCCHHVLALYEL